MCNTRTWTTPEETDYGAVIRAWWLTYSKSRHNIGSLDPFRNKLLFKLERIRENKNNLNKRLYLKTKSLFKLNVS